MQRHVLDDSCLMRYTAGRSDARPEGLYTFLAIPFIFFLTFLVLAFLDDLAIASPPPTRSQKNQDIVFLVDASSSMLSIFNDVKQAIFEYALQARPGDNFVLISFGEKVELLIRQKISTKEDVRLIQRELMNLKPTQDHTYITGALDKGMEELRVLAEKNPDHMRTIVLMSDGKNNPPGNIVEPMTFDDILQKYPGLLRGPNSAFFYLSLGDDPDPQVVSFIESAQGLSFNLAKGIGPGTQVDQGKIPLAFAEVFVEPVSLDLGTVYGPKATAHVSLAFFPARGDPAGKVITATVSARYKENPSWKTIIEVSPTGINCSDKSWSKSFVVNIESLHEGTVVGTLELKPPLGQVLFIEPSEIPITMTISQPRVKTVVAGRLEFGPINPKTPSKETQSVLLIPNAAAAAEDIRATCDIFLPEGMKLVTSVEKKDTMRELVITVETDETFKPSHSMRLEGTLHLSGTTLPIEFSTDELEVLVTVAAPSPSSRAITLASSLVKFKRYIFIGVIAAVIAGLAVYWALRERNESALEGKLVVLHIKGKPDHGSRLVTANLHSMGKSLGLDSITIGSAKEAGLTLPHKSVATHHCQIYARVDKGKTRMFIEPVGKNTVILNLQRISEPTPLSDRDMVEIGAYTFRFENPHPYKQIVVKYLDGRMLKGTPATWDIESNGFSLLPRDALPGSNEEIYVSFSDLKAVYFVRDFDGQIGKKIVSPASQIHGVHMKLTFHDGEKMEGYTSESYNPSSLRFYFFPADQSGNTISLVVERKNLKSVDIVEEVGHPTAAVAQKTANISAPIRQVYPKKAQMPSNQAR